MDHPWTNYLTTLPTKFYMNLEKEKAKIFDDDKYIHSKSIKTPRWREMV